MLSLSVDSFYRPQRSCEGYVFTPVSHFVLRGEYPQAGIPPRTRYPPAGTLPWQVHLPWAGTPPGQVHPPGQVRPPGPGTHPWAGTPPSRYTPRQVHPLPLGRYIPHPLGRHTPQAGTPPGQVHYPPGQLHPPLTRYNPGPRYTPPPADDYCCGRYASYWNAFLFNC